MFRSYVSRARLKPAGCSARQSGHHPLKRRKTRGAAARSCGCWRKFEQALGKQRSWIMARNRKSQSAAIRFGPALKALMLCLLIGGSGVGYVWQKEQISRLGRQIKAREVRLKELDGQNEMLRRQLGKMRSPQFLEARVKELNLGLVEPLPAQKWRLPEPMGDVPSRTLPEEPEAPQIAAHSTR